MTLEAAPAGGSRGGPPPRPASGPRYAGAAVAAAACLLLAGTLAVAALAKLADRAAFRATLSRLVAPPLARTLTLAVPAAELALAAALVCGLGGRLAPAAALLLLLAFTAVLGRAVPCRCFGAAGDGDPAAARVRNALLGAAAAALIVWPAGPLWEVPAGELAGAATVAAGLACAWSLARALTLQAGARRRRRPRPEAGRGMSPVWIVSMVLAWIVIALLCAVVLSLLRQLGELRGRLAALDPFAAAADRVVDAALYAPVPPFVIDAGGEPLVLGGERDQPALLVVYEPGCDSCRGIEAALAAEPEPDCMLVPVTDAGDLPPDLRPHSVPAAIGIAREGVVCVLGRPTTEAELREAAQACAGAVIGPDTGARRRTAWGTCAPFWEPASR